jgi:hypothetical protein
MCSVLKLALRLFAEHDLTQNVAVQVRKLKICDDAIPVAAGSSKVCQKRGVEGTEDYKFAKLFDWDSNLKLWQDERRKSDPVNPITAFLGSLLTANY